MSKINAYNFITLNGFFKSAGGNYSWHKHGKEEAEYAAKSANTDGILLFGRITFEMMAGYWPSAAAEKNAPEVPKE